MKNQFGLTLIELLVTLSVIAILIALVAPRMGTITGSSKQAAAANSLVTDIAYTRNEAVTRNSDVTIAAKSGDWNNGWTVTTADPSDSTKTLTLRNISTVAAGVSVSGTGATSITYKGDGSQSSGAAAILFCNSNLPSGNTSGLQIEIKTITGRQTLNSKVTCP